MKMRLLLVAMLAAIGSAAVAQSSMTLFGVIDLAGRVVSNDETQYQLASGGDKASRLGLRGTETLGDGWSAGFWLEASLAPDTANSSFSFDRRSTVSLISRGIGELRLGRDWVPTYREWLDLDPFGDAGLGKSTNLAVANGMVPSGGAYNTLRRADNLISYFTPGGLGGLYAQLSVAAGEGQLGNKYVGGRLGYSDGPLVGSTSWGKTQVTANDDGEMWNVGGSYDFKSLQLMGFYSSFEIGSSMQENWLLGIAAPFGPWLLRGSYQGMSGKEGLSGQEAWGLAVGVQYSLSKRTALYATYSTISNTNTSFTVASDPPLTRGNDSKGLDLGIRHSF
jgi:predicted porin